MTFLLIDTHLLLSQMGWSEALFDSIGLKRVINNIIPTNYTRHDNTCFSCSQKYCAGNGVNKIPEWVYEVNGICLCDTPFCYISTSSESRWEEIWEFNRNMRNCILIVFYVYSLLRLIMIPLNLSRARVSSYGIIVQIYIIKNFVTRPTSTLYGG